MGPWLGPQLSLNVFNAMLQVREKMTLYWEEHSKDASVEEMMLDTNAAQFNAGDKAEILRLLPSLEVHILKGG